MRILKGDIIAASGEFTRGSGLERGRPLPSRDTTKVTLPSGRESTYGLNANGQTSAVTAEVAGSPVNLATSITYLPFGPQTGMTYGSSLTFSAGYDQNYWPTFRALSGFYNHAYNTDAAGNITGIDSTDFGYDALNRLDEEDSGSATTYTYDATSNRLTKINGGTVTTTVPSGSNKISAVGSDSYTYDASGNITDDGVREYVWDSTGRLEEVKISSSTVGAYTYNAYNQRTKKVAGTTTHYVYGAGGLLYGEYDNSGDLIREYVYLNGQPLAQVDAGSPETLTYLHPDHLGTPKFGTNAGGTQVWAWAPDAFGGGTPSGSVTVNLRMPGQYFDAESGLFYNWNRYYNPAIGRYISSDPIGLEGGINTFLYAAASPVMLIDPEGLIEVPDGTMGPLRPSDYWTAEMTKTDCGNIPPAPPGANIYENMSNAALHLGRPDWFYRQVRNKGTWDYKQDGAKYQDFGNFNFGATGAAFGFSENILLRGAGWAQSRAGTSLPKWGSWQGSAPYGDDPNDQTQISSGYSFCQCMLNLK